MTTTRPSLSAIAGDELDGDYYGEAFGSFS